MEKKQKKVLFAKSGAGNETTRVSIPASWFKKIGVTKEDSNIFTYLLDDNTILITKNEIKGEEIMKKTFEFGKSLQKKLKKEEIFHKAQNVQMKLGIDGTGYAALHELFLLCLEAQSTIPLDIGDLLTTETAEIRKNTITEIIGGLISE